MVRACLGLRAVLHHYYLLGDSIISQGRVRIWSTVFIFCQFFKINSYIHSPIQFKIPRKIESINFSTTPNHRWQIFNIQIYSKCRNFSRIDRNWKFLDCSSQMFLHFSWQKKTVSTIIKKHRIPRIVIFMIRRWNVLIF